MTKNHESRFTVDDRVAVMWPESSENVRFWGMVVGVTFVRGRVKYHVMPDDEMKVYEVPSDQVEFETVLAKQIQAAHAAQN